MRTITYPELWQKISTAVFWGEIAPCDHVVQIYERDEVFLDALFGYVHSGLTAGDAIIIIATPTHIHQLEIRLKLKNHDLNKYKNSDQLIILNAHEVLSEFMVNGWPDETLFMSTVSKIMKRARGNNRKVRAFGEMVAILWAEGNSGATVQLEHLWNMFCEGNSFSLLCAYPKSGFSENANESLNHICGTHSKIISGDSCSRDEVLYKRKIA